MKTTSALILALACMSMGAAHAQQVYKTEKNGVTVYSERPQSGGSAVKLPDLSIVTGGTSAPAPRSNNGISLPPPGSSSGSTLLPPPPPSLSGPASAPTANTAPQSTDKQMTLDEAKKSLEAAKKELAEQEEVRYGNEKNYQKKLDRLKPYEDKVNDFSKKLEELKNK